MDDFVAYARRINNNWITNGTLAADTENYLNHLAACRPEELPTVCRRAVEAARHASKLTQDPKPPFYASLFCTASKAERNQFLHTHFFTLLLSTEYQLSDEPPDQD